MLKRIFLALSILLIGGPAALSAPIPNRDCLDCHDDKDLTKKDASGKAVSLCVEKKKFNASVHAKKLCVDCHTDVTEAPHPEKWVAKRPSCTACHEEQSKSYGASVHGESQAGGNHAAARCVDCHTTHEVQSPRSAASALFYTRQAATCGKCHPKVAADYQRSVHGTTLAAGVREAPTCTDCHNEHKIERLKGAATLRIAEQVCGRCHASEQLATRFNLPAGRMATFTESFHGLAARLGSTRAANCASCHGWHDVLPSSDPASRIHASNLPTTCGACHPGIGTRLAQEPLRIHAALGATDGNHWLVSLVAHFYIVLIILLIGGMVAHNLLDYVVKVRAHLREARETGLPRFSAAIRAQHIAMMVLFIVLAYTGFVHRYPDAFLSWPFRALPHGNAIRSQIHRICGWTMLALLVIHAIGMLGTQAGRKALKDLMPQPRDIKDVWARLMANLGRGEAPADHPRFDYVEKSEYWALVWGSVVMALTGAMMIFTEAVLRLLPKFWLDVAQVVHYYEALLATLAILVWHLYAVVFDPRFYPMNTAWLTGKRLPPQPVGEAVKEENSEAQNPRS